jgi:exonuclease SbcD
MEKPVRCSFVQFGDIHLGTLQYDSLERLNDFGRAWLHACNYIVETGPDFAICTGDLFNRFTINPITFEQAFAGLRLLRDAGIPIVDVMGNHDRTRYNEARSWLHTFADQGLLTLLDVETRADGVTLTPVDTTRHVGSYVDWGDCRIIGARYLGASTESILKSLEPELARLRRDGRFTILVLHAGLEGIVPNFNAELTAAALEQLRGLVDYVALGHIHKHYAIGNFAFNAGSLETWAMNEWVWERGLLKVQIDTDASPVVSVERVDVPGRPFLLMRVDVGKFDSPNDLLRGCFDRLQTERRRAEGTRPVAVLTLHGRLRFDASDVPVNLIENAGRQLLDPLVIQVREQYDSREFSDEGAPEEDDVIDRAMIERDVLRAKFAADERYAANAIGLAKLTSQLKERALQDGDGPALLQVLRDGLAALSESSEASPTALAGAATTGPTE